MSFFSRDENGLGLAKLTFFAIGTTLASGVFSLSGDFAANGSYPLAVLIGWLICGIGMLGLMMSFFRLSIVKPELKSGIFSYAREGFGEYIGFNSAWGYWMSALLAQVSFTTLFFAAMGHFFTVFGEGNNFISIAMASVIIWLITILILRGVNQAVTINALIVIAKILPILVMIVAIIMVGAFDMKIFMSNFDGRLSDLSLFEQVKATTYVTVWIFIGIEGAVVLSARAKNTKIAGWATALSFFSLLALYMVISILSMGVMTTEELAALGNPPMAGILEKVVGPWGAALVNFAVIVSLGGALFTYSILCMDSAFQPAAQKSFPAVFARINKNKAPTVALISSTLIIQIFLIIVFFNESTYQIVYTLSTSAIMFPYALSGLYLLKITISGESTRGLEGGQRMIAWVVAVLGSVYGLWLLYVSGVTYILISALLYAPGTLLYYWSRKERNLPIFPKTEDKIAFVVVAVAFAASIFMIANGSIKPF